MNPTKYKRNLCGLESLEMHYHEIYYRGERPTIYMCDRCYFMKGRPKIDFYGLKYIKTINNEPQQLTLWGDLLFLT